MGIIKLKERRVSPEIILDTTPPAAPDADLDSSSKEESFQDSRPYLASDSEDDYHSVKGTPSSRPGTPQRPRIGIKNIYYHSMLERRRIRLITPPTRATTMGVEAAPAQPPPPRDQKPLIEFFTDPYWNEQISTDADISHPTTATKQMRLVEFLQDSFWKKEFFLTPSPKSGKPPVSSGAVVVASLKSGSKRVQNAVHHDNVPSSKAADDQCHGGGGGGSCCFPSFAPRFWSKKRKTKVASA